MAMRSKRRFLIMTTLLIGFGLAVGGIVLGIRATTVPNVMQGGFDENVSVWVDQPDIPVDVSFSVDPDGEINVYVGTGVQSPNFVRPSFNAYIVLTCDARLQDPLVTSESEVETPPKAQRMDFGDEELCQVPTVFAIDLATQVITVPVSGPNSTVITGLPIKPWTASGAGHRVSRTPQVVLGRDDLFADELASLDPLPPSDGSKLSVSLDAMPTETIDIFVPEGNDATTVSTSAAIYDFGKSSGPVILSSVSWSASGADAAIQAGFVRWNDSAGTAAAQLNLLLSGAFLGVAASVLIEFLIDRSRMERKESKDGPSGIPSTSPPPPRGKPPFGWTSGARRIAGKRRQRTRRA